MPSPDNHAETEMRFSDAQLIQLREDFDMHKADQDARWERQDARWDEMGDMVRANTQATHDLAESTRGVVQLYSDVQGTVRVGVAVQKFCTWLVKWGAIGTAAAAVISWVVKNWNP